MPRIKLSLPDSFPFSTEIDVRVRDLNYGNHLGNDALLGLIHEARVRFFRSLGFTEADAGGAGIVMGDAQIVYKAEAFGGDVLRFDVAVGEIGRIDADIFYRATRTSDDKCIAEAKTNIVFFDYGTRRVVAVPKTFRERVAAP
jgi:4-hydroxybenzoyl-CoA thioesterase